MSIRILAGIIALAAPSAVAAKTVSLSCVVDQSSSRPADAQKPNGSVGEKYIFTFDTAGGDGSVERQGRNSDGQAITENWSAPVALTPTHAVFDFSIQHAPRTIVSHLYRIDRAKLNFEGSKDAFGYIKFFISGPCKMEKAAQRINQF